MQNPLVEGTNQLPDPTQTAPAVRPQNENTSDYYHTKNIPDRFEHPGEAVKAGIKATRHFY
jgi:hypothetical protein